MQLPSVGAACSMMLMALLSSPFAAQKDPPAGPLLQRSYVNGAVLHYEMAGSNAGWEYTIHATDLVKRDQSGKFYQEIGWSDLRSNASQVLSPASLALRQTVSLDDPAKYMVMPDLSKVQPFLIGPLVDMLTFYSDVVLATNAQLNQSTPHAYVERDRPNSWADGQRVLIGEDAVDFDLTLVDTNARDHTITLLVQHVPPKESRVQLPASWMKAPVGEKPNNFVQVERSGDTYTADVGQETFDVRITLDSRDGKMVEASMSNPVVLVSKNCKDRELTNCGPATRKTTAREIKLRLVP